MKENNVLSKFTIWLTNVMSALVVASICYAAKEFTDTKAEIAKMREALARVEVNMKESDQQIRDNAKDVHSELISKCANHETRISILEAKRIN